MPATLLTEPEISSRTGERPLDLLNASERELARLGMWGTTDQQAAVELIAWQMLEGAQNLRRWIWTLALVALTLLAVVLFAPSP